MNLEKYTGFQWDKGNYLKNWEKHGVRPSECEQIFLNRPLIVAPDPKHSHKEERYYALGHTDADRLLFMIFTIRRDLIRVISARDMNKREEREFRGQ